ncbi:hypothetical protein KAFR_0B01580 [Kazachstania africana CBS 2517]|uniref:Raptor N-terminal CASPase-like domain-containing protein n=1 Tax=Kazachstania africana (strain ATCC 22294 / BCRC 22015 / CBS 2517 / CECT 1963 / NBRC 1671 / NRRL Y-8276) TaxID=1071382 RepID=H2AQ07_KAZAF|nr:hypothetical protein KAFR_0B01580 [Kazachstania africana CBS 2517]CCF56457.1 hypothetical protein KAFR_0B01580 [Kazachstania africana CBS 2517]
MQVFYGPQPLKPLNTEMRHGFDEQYKDEQFLQSLANEFIFYFDDKKHLTSGNPIPEEVKAEDRDRYYQPILDWKITKDRQKTVSAALLLCLNLGVDPPDVIKTHPCARMEAWVDPLNFQDSKKAIEQIGKNLQSQYETLSLRTRYKQSLDPCVEDVKRFCNSLRRTSRDDQILFHYNGHGVPRPTSSGEIWVFNRGYTQYIPVSLYDLQTWLGAPCIFVYDCNNAGNIVTNFKKFVNKRIIDDEEGNHDAAASSPTSAYKDCYQLASCGADELLLMSPELPADLFTCCLTCPIEISVRVFLLQSPLKDTKYKIFFEAPNPSGRSSKDSMRNKIPNVHIPGTLSDRRTPLGELNWIFTAITDTIAWTSLPRPLFKKLFRHDLMIAALFRNFLLAKRIIPWYNCHPISDPELPDSIATHPMWKSWDLAIDEVLDKIIYDLKNSPQTSELEAQMILRQQESFQSKFAQQEQHDTNKQESVHAQSRFAVGNLSTMSLATHPALQTRKSQVGLRTVQQSAQQQFTGFFEQNLTAFELWLKYASNVRNPPEQLPIVLQVLLSQAHRIRALVLLSRFLDLGPWGVYLSLSIGIFPYVLKLLQSPAPELKPILVFIWARIMSIDYKNTQADLIKERGYMYFIHVIVPQFGMSASSSLDNSVPFSPLSSNAPQNGRLYINDQQFNGTATPNTPPYNHHINDTTDEQKAMAVFVLASFVRDFALGQKYTFHLELVQKLCTYSTSSEVPLLRQWSAILLGLLFVQNPLHKSISMKTGVLDTLLNCIRDPVPEVRTAALLSLNFFISTVDDNDFIGNLQQEYEQQFQQLQYQAQQIQTNIHQKQNHQQQQHFEIQLSKIEKQLSICQYMQSELELIEIKKLKSQEITNLIAVLGLINDGSPLVRKEAIVYFSQVVERYITFFIVVAFNELTLDIAQLEGLDPESMIFADKHPISHGSVFNTVWKALLILAGDPYLENRRKAEQVIDYILAELSAHKDLEVPFSKLEHYLMKRSAKGSTNNKMGFSVNPSKTQVKSFTPSINGTFDKNSKYNQNMPDTENTLHNSTSLGRLFKSFRIGDMTSDNEDNVSILSNNEKKGISLLSVSHGTSPVPRTPRYKEPRLPLTFPLKSSFLDYASEYFQEPQMRKQEADEVGSLEYNAKLWRRNRNDVIIRETQSQKTLALYGDWSKKFSTLDNKSQPKVMNFNQFEDQLVVGDDKDNISVFDIEKKLMISRFSNGNPFGTKITDIKFINEDDIGLLMCGSSDGIIKIYRSYSSSEDVEMISAWRGLTEMLLTPRSSGLITNWQQIRGSLLTTGDVKIIRVWDAHTESIELDIPAKSSSLITSLTSDQLVGNIFVAGFADGSLRVYDRRMEARDAVVRRWRSTGNNGAFINNVQMQRGGYRELVSGTSKGVVDLWDIRSQHPVNTFYDENYQQTGDQRRTTTMTSMQLHEHAPILATGTRQIKIWTTSGDLLSRFKNSHGLMGSSVASTFAATGITSYSSNSFISSMAFHPHRMILAAASSHDSNINVYKCVDSELDFY